MANMLNSYSMIKTNVAQMLEITNKNWAVINTLLREDEVKSRLLDFLAFAVMRADPSLPASLDEMERYREKVIRAARKSDYQGREKSALDGMVDLLYDILVRFQKINKEMYNINETIKLLRTGVQVWIPEPTDINECVREVLNFYQPPRKKINVEHSLTKKDTVSLAKDTVIKEFLKMLIKNAEEAIIMGAVDDGKIKVITSRQKNRIRLQVTNNGPRINTEARKRLFSDKAFTTKLDGEHGGRALFIIQKTLDMMKGKIRFTSGEHETTFTISLPAYQREG